MGCDLCGKNGNINYKNKLTVCSDCFSLLTKFDEGEYSSADFFSISGRFSGASKEGKLYIQERLGRLNNEKLRSTSSKKDSYWQKNIGHIMRVIGVAEAIVCFFLIFRFKDASKEVYMSLLFMVIGIITAVFGHKLISATKKVNQILYTTIPIVITAFTATVLIVGNVYSLNKENKEYKEVVPLLTEKMQDRVEILCAKHGLDDVEITFGEITKDDYSGRSETAYSCSITIKSDKYMSLSANDAFFALEDLEHVTVRYDGNRLSCRSKIESGDHIFLLEKESSGSGKDKIYYTYVIMDYVESVITSKSNEPNWYSIVWSNTNYFK